AADVAVAARHLVETPIGAAGAAAARPLLDRLRADRDARLTQRNDELTRRRVIARRLPVVPAFRARAAVDPIADFVLENVAPIARRARLAVEALPDVLEDRLDVAEVAAGPAIVLPEDAVLADGHDPLL